MKWWVRDKNKTPLWETPKTVGTGPARPKMALLCENPYQIEGQRGLGDEAGRRAWLTMA